MQTHRQTKWIWCLVIMGLMAWQAQTIVTAGVPSVAYDITKLKHKCTTRHDQTECKISAKLNATNNTGSEVPDIHVRFFLSTDSVYDVDVDTFVTDDNTGSIKAGKTRKVKLKESLQSSASGLFLLAVDDSDNVLAFEPIP